MSTELTTKDGLDPYAEVKARVAKYDDIAGKIGPVFGRYHVHDDEVLNLADIIEAFGLDLLAERERAIAAYKLELEIVASLPVKEAQEREQSTLGWLKHRATAALALVERGEHLKHGGK